jgi:hypothetical protein
MHFAQIVFVSASKLVQFNYRLWIQAMASSGSAWPRGSVAKAMFGRDDSTDDEGPKPPNYPPPAAVAGPDKGKGKQDDGKGQGKQIARKGKADEAGKGEDGKGNAEPDKGKGKGEARQGQGMARVLQPKSKALPTNWKEKAAAYQAAHPSVPVQRPLGKGRGTAQASARSTPYDKSGGERN